MSTRSRDGSFGRSQPAVERTTTASGFASPGGPVTRKRAASINTTEANNSSRLEDLSLHTPPAGSPHSTDSSRDLICLCTPAPKVPRPRNAFILYRQHHQAGVVAQHPGLANPEISKIIGEQWRDQPEEVKSSWKRLAEEEKARHQRQYPDYRYQPRRGGKGGPSARAATSSGEDPGRCPKCGGRYIATPRTPSTPFPGATPTSKQPPPSMPPYMTPNSRGSETPHYRQARPGDTPMVGDSHGRPPYHPRHPSLHDIDEDYDMMSPSDPKRRRFHGPGHYQPVSSPVPFGSHQPTRHMTRPSIAGPPPLSASSYGPSGGPLPGPSMLGRPSSGPMPPPPRPSVSYNPGPPPAPRNPGFDESLRLPPLQTQLPSSPTSASDASTGGGPSASAGLVGLGIGTAAVAATAPQSLRESQARSIEAMVMSIPYLNKLKVLGRISPPLAPPGPPASPAAETRGPVIAVEGAVPRLLRAVGRVVERTLEGSGECALRVWSDGGGGGPVPLSGNSSSSAASEDAGPSAAGAAAEGQSPEKDKSRSTSLSSASGAVDGFQRYMQTIMEWHDKSREMVKHVTTETSPEKQDQQPGVKGESSSAGPGRDSSDAPKRQQQQQQLLPVALVPDGFSLTLADRFACSVPIADSYAPVDHWQWMATLWRGIVGPDLVVYVRSATEDEVARLGGVDFKTPSVMVVRVNEARGLDEKTERRLAFEVMEWVRSGNLKEGFGRE
ncbi:HMG box protein [Pleurostoma richardsiae]|uniref:HMG box protein n=1 Tax=Pleurostoma richardsiae TaxID=41990 RepID=A0AA38VHV1_9PEZI|nr:HMG box protein [Pleurostoma richardsiae]